MLCVLCMSLPLCLAACGSSSPVPADQPTTEITRTDTTAPSERPAVTTTAAPEPEKPGTTARTTVTEQHTETSAADETSAEETTAVTSLSEDVTTTESAAVTSALAVPEHVRIVISAEEIMEAAGFSADERLSCVLDIENTAADAGNVMVARERPWSDPDAPHPDWLYRVTEITVDGITPGQTVTVSGIAVDNECGISTDPESWFAAKRVPFTITRTAAAGN